MGLEGTDEATLATVKKGGSRGNYRQAIQLLRQHGMIELCTLAVGLGEETDRDCLTLLRHLLAYDPDQVMSVYATPHRWTPFHNQSAHRRVIQTDLRLWDCKHQVLETPKVPAWRNFLWIKLTEACLQLRPKSQWRVWLHPDPDLRHAMRRYTRIGRGPCPQIPFPAANRKQPWAQEPHPRPAPPHRRDEGAGLSGRP